MVGVVGVEGDPLLLYYVRDEGGSRWVQLLRLPGKQVRCTFGRSRHAEGLPSICRMCQPWPFPGFHDTEECLPI